MTLCPFLNLATPGRFDNAVSAHAPPVQLPEHPAPQVDPTPQPQTPPAPTPRNPKPHPNPPTLPNRILETGAMESVTPVVSNFQNQTPPPSPPPQRPPCPPHHQTNNYPKPKLQKAHAGKGKDRVRTTSRLRHHQSTCPSPKIPDLTPKIPNPNTQPPQIQTPGQLSLLYLASPNLTLQNSNLKLQTQTCDHTPQTSHPTPQNPAHVENGVSDASGRRDTRPGRARNQDSGALFPERRVAEPHGSRYLWRGTHPSKPGRVVGLNHRVS